MSFLAPKLKHRIQIQGFALTPDTQGLGYLEKTYSTFGTIWAAIKDESARAGYVKAVRAENIEAGEVADTVFLVRYLAVKNLGKAFDSGFSASTDSLSDLNPVKADNFIFLQVGNNTARGRLYKILRTSRDDDRQEWLKIETQFVEERGTGAIE